MSNKERPIYIASDHAGFPLKQHLLRKFPELHWVDLGPVNEDRVDYPHFADRLVTEVLKTKGIGVLVCGSGQGMAIRANRYQGIRAALCWNQEVARLSRAHNDANVLCLGARAMETESCEAALFAFLETEFEGGRHADRVAQLDRPTS